MAIAAAPKASPSPETLQVQVALDRSGFSPGVIDGHSGATLSKALKGFQAAHDLPQSGQPDGATKAALTDVAGTVDYTLTAKDFAGPFVGPMPSKPADQAKLPAMGYADAMEQLAERFHTTPDTLRTLNAPGTKLVAGAKIKVPNVLPAATAYPESFKPDWRAELALLNVSSDQPKAAKLEVSKSQGVLRVLDADGKLLAQFPATMGSTHDPLPIGHWKVQGTSYLPTYHFNPALFWDAKPGESKETMKGGPNSPVGVVWMDLDKPHYGIHGTPNPEKIGRTESHGCIRLTNWDAARLSLMVKPGTPADFVE
ncbi:lipoprotein-anchoring transpeptidase ErfK/SrfK [Sphingomonas vulcanisoli]|uniref:Lipoprotein-anchoring transpeptidase ErfK/SrfK n=1 Tax=Sphingomonas vulcanisoli TaxID=1658060 RepID=A0ABX0TSE1_9SPHN|nr:lipoprotein-anchoring transpeptidase ErfK/SrfK [Sphingomonas vulcanisoli]